MKRPATESETLEVHFSTCRTIHEGDDRLKKAIAEHLKHLLEECMHATFIQG